MKKWRFLMALGVLTTGLAMAFSGTPHPEWVGKPVPNLATVANINKIAVSRLSGQAVMVFVVPNCGSCVLQLTTLAQVANKNRSLKMVVVTSQNTPELQGVLRSFQTKPVVLTDSAGVLVKSFGLRQVPALVLLNQEQIVQGFYEGILDRDDLENLTTPLSTGKVVPQLTVPGNPGALADAISGVNFSNSKNNMLVFHSYSCIHCKNEIPDLVNFAKKNSAVNVWVVAVNELEGVQKQFSEANAPVNVRVVLSEKSFSDYRISGTPTQILVSNDSTIRWRNSGFAPGLFETIPLATTAR
jgi:thiol-disulfide isomerase/thioredoxin